MNDNYNSYSCLYYGFDLTDFTNYSETPLFRIPGDQLNLFELEGFRIKGD